MRNHNFGIWALLDRVTGSQAYWIGWKDAQLADVLSHERMNPNSIPWAQYAGEAAGDYMGRILALADAT